MISNAENSLLTCVDHADERALRVENEGLIRSDKSSRRTFGKPMGEFRPERCLPYISKFDLDSNTVTDILGFMNRWTIQELAETVNAWCRDRALQPANGQTASELAARTLHYYRSTGLLDAPESGTGRGYGRRHLLQLKAIRILQAQGLPLSRIQQLLFARSDEELEQIAESAGEIEPQPADVCSRTFASKETWTVYPLNEQLFVVARNGAVLSRSQLDAIGKICDAPPTKSSKSTLRR
jgi:DNA-binding transcriptional MerR regulator